MSLIKQPSEIVGKETISALIYGQSGMGKTTLACSAPAPVLFDFDNGVSRIRAEHQVPTVQIARWQDAMDALAELTADRMGFRTVIIDTASKMIDSITEHICGAANPKLQQWGSINNTFKAFNRTLRSLGLNVVYVAQREVEKNGEDTRYVPQFRQSNYKDVLCDLDVCGYMEMATVRGKEMRRITFDPTSRNEGKNTANFDRYYDLPTLDEGKPNNFLAVRFADYVERQRAMNEQRAKMHHDIAAIVADFRNELDTVTDADAFSDLVQRAATMQHVGDSKARLAVIIRDEAAKRGYKFNKQEGRYE